MITTTDTQSQKSKTPAQVTANSCRGPSLPLSACAGDFSKGRTKKCQYGDGSQKMTLETEM